MFFSPTPPNADRVHGPYAYTLRQFDFIKCVLRASVSRVRVFKINSCYYFLKTRRPAPCCCSSLAARRARSLWGFRAHRKTGRTNSITVHSNAYGPRRRYAARCWGFSVRSTACLTDGKQREMYTPRYARTKTA